MRARLAFGLVFAFASISFACSSSSDNGTPTNQDSGTTGDTGKTDSGTDTHVADTAPDGPTMCWIGHPTDSSSVECDSCSFDKCKAQWDAAYGANYLSDDFTGGACADDATCNCGCAEEDAICKEGCDVSETSACHDAKTAIEDCEKTNCTDICGFDELDGGSDSADASGG